MPLNKPKHGEKSAKMDYLRGFATRSISEGRAGGGERQKTPPLSPSPYTIPRSATSANLNSAVHRRRPPLPNTDPLPIDLGALEGLMNHHASQLKKLADRVESVNEWLEMDGIVLARLVTDARHHFKKEIAEKVVAAEPDSGHIVTPSSPTAPLSRGLSPGLGRPRTPVVHFEEPKNRKSSDAEIDVEEKMRSNCNIRDVKERIQSMKKWRKELERSVYWQREEYWRIETQMGKERDSIDVTGRINGEDGWGVGGKTWEKGSGRLPTQVEWEVMFAPERIVWDDAGARPKF